MDRYHAKPEGKKVRFTAAEEAACDAEEAAFEAAAPMEKWEADMRASNAGGMTDDLENIIDSMSSAQKASVASETMDKFNAKQSLRGRKPSA